MDRGGCKGVKGGRLERVDCRRLDAADPLAHFRERFAAPADGRIFFDANSIGRMPASVPERVSRLFADDWVGRGRRSWSRGAWLERPRQIGAALAPFLGALPEDVLAGDSTTVNLFKLLTCAWRARRSGSVILTEAGNFPSDLYVAQGLRGVVEGGPEIRTCAGRGALLDAIGPETAVVYLSHVDYRSSERWDMAEVNARACAAEALTVWDLSHSAGAVPVDLMGTDADHAVGCGYKYFGAGPGGPAWLWVHPRHGGEAWPTICGWMGHEDPFAFDERYAPAPGAARHGAGTPTVIANEVAWCAAEIRREVEPAKLWEKHRRLSELLIALVEQECGALGVALQSPRDHGRRGGHVSFTHPAAGPVVEALFEAGVVASFRKPDSIRFGPGALNLRYEDVWEAAARLREVLETGRWRDPRFRKTAV